MRNIVIGADGTWNKPDQVDRQRQVPSNVVKAVRSVLGKSPHIEQLRYYDTGVGTAGLFDKLRGGMAGNGLFGNMRKAYAWLLAHYQPDDRLFLFGFSRGAFTVRSLAGMLAVCGIPPCPGETAGQTHKQAMAIADEAAQVYRIHDADERKQAGQAFRAKYRSLPGDVHFLGVWDTVGAMGLPTKGPLGWLTRSRHRFHDVCLGDNVRHAYHALAINEQRAPFEPSLWLPPCPPQCETVEQVWFAGVHSNVGGGYADAGLSDQALLWMLEAAGRHGLQLDPHYLKRRIDANAFGELRESLSVMYKTPLTGMPRLRDIGTGALGEAIHPSVFRRWRAPSRPEDPPANVMG
ncbi:DUF2235 domain-containing protein [Pseudohongiella sp.]|uniref:T6SS Phospholipase effector Tle1-like catalytic domain-containing protein n=1 Tax=marine sediment metagenome TaxID=412755 RepID=A0A0F9YI20_9ZZZZ|nr:DUF2235 domain-containing protein [Pseudohongiella sp.]HDZ08485.1 DUF2235 domain-containing protein [Pseudohongiella sp.]HEA61777.1 DUF2235 domain-containing protein [Pseudohongiella sp.]